MFLSNRLSPTIPYVFYRAARARPVLFVVGAAFLVGAGRVAGLVLGFVGVVVVLAGALVVVLVVVLFLVGVALLAVAFLVALLAIFLLVGALLIGLGMTQLEGSLGLFRVKANPWASDTSTRAKLSPLALAVV